MKNKISAQVHLALVLMLTMLFVSSANAASWEPKAKKLFEDDEYEKCIEITEAYKKDNQATMFLAFSHLQENVFNGAKYDKEKFKAYTTRLEAKLGIDDMSDLLYFVKLDDKPYVVKEARSLAKVVFKNINDIDDVPKLVSFLNVKDEDTRKLALASIQRILKPKRDYVKKGGTLRSKDIKIMGSESLIVALLEQVELSKAKASLQLIEEPVLKHTGNFSSVVVSKLETSINSKIAARQKKYPKSNWYSAVGKER